MFIDLQICNLCSSCATFKTGCEFNNQICFKTDLWIWIYVFQVLQNLGKADKTIDDELEQSLEHFNEQQVHWFHRFTFLNIIRKLKCMLNEHLLVKMLVTRINIHCLLRLLGSRHTISFVLYATFMDWQYMRDLSLQLFIKFTICFAIPLYTFWFHFKYTNITIVIILCYL